MVVHYDGKNQGLAGKAHSACVSYWHGTRDFHVDGNGWLDIGYAYGVCPHGYVFEGRGFNRQQAAEEPTPGKLQNGNSRWVSCTYMSGPLEYPTAKQLEAFQELRKWLMGKGLGSTIHGHRDFSSTDCPGDILYRMVKNKTILEPAPEKEDDPLAGMTKKDIFDAVWATDGIAAPPDQADVKTNPNWQAQSHLKDINNGVRAIKKQNAQLLAIATAQGKTIDALVATVASQTKAFNATEFLAQLREEMSSAINDLNISLVVGDNPEED